MHYFDYKATKLYGEGVSIERIAKEVGTPVFIYSHKTLVRHYNAFDSAFKDASHIICYSVKANSNLSVLKTFSNLGSGFDIVSGGELKRVIKAGGDPTKVVFSGVGKSEEEIAFAIKKRILLFNVESPQELRLLNKVAVRLKTRARVALRVNPDVDPKTHPYISTGLKQNKFGIETEEAVGEYLYAQKRLKSLDMIGIDCHIGSQITTLKPFVDTLKKIKALTTRLRTLGVDISYVNMGGGLGITYDNEKAPHPSKYGEAVLKATRGLDVTLIFEPGRNLVGNAGILVTKVLYTKKGADKNFIITDAAMNDLPRPSLYDSYHAIKPVTKTRRREITADVVGPICESGDFLARDRELKEVRPGELLSVMSAGAYCFTMSSNYNTRTRAAEVMVKGRNLFVIREREKHEELFKKESMPEKLFKK
ncbi:MAG: diaminopimelate decarboxylase [Deltaproteobacteria bacterium]|nr:diaminopimelate decarboxylase [Deltaproteobacteria bacterium]